MSQSPAEPPAAGDPALTQAWREASRDEPATAVDDAIRAAARRAVHARPRPASASPFGGRWRVPLSVAALVVVSATVTLLVAERDRHGAGALHDQAAPPAVRSPQTPTGAATTDTPEPSARQFAEGPAPAPTAGVAPARDQPKQTTPQAQSKQTQAAAPEERKRMALPAPPASAQTSQARAQFEDRPASPAPASAAAQGATQSTGSEQPKAAGKAPTPMMRDDAASNAAAQVRTDEAVSGLGKREDQAVAKAEDRAAAKAQDRAAAKAQDQAAAKAQDQAAAKAKERTAEQAPTAARAESALPAREPAAVPAESRVMTRAAPPVNASTVQTPGAAQSPVQSPVQGPAQSLEPKAWLDHIAELRRLGKLEEAEASLKAFRQHYPDYPLPPELKSPR